MNSGGQPHSSTLMIMHLTAYDWADCSCRLTGQGQAHARPSFSALPGTLCLLHGCLRVSHAAAATGAASGCTCIHQVSHANCQFRYCCINSFISPLSPATPAAPKAPGACTNVLSTRQQRCCTRPVMGHHYKIEKAAVPHCQLRGIGRCGRLHHKYTPEIYVHTGKSSLNAPAKEALPTLLVV